LLSFGQDLNFQGLAISVTVIYKSPATFRPPLPVE